MVTKLTRILSFLLVLAMAITMVSCTGKKDPKKGNGKKEPVASQPANPDDTADGEVDNIIDGENIFSPDYIPGGDFWFEDDYNYSGDSTDGAVNVVIPETSYSTQSPAYEDGLEGGDGLENLPDIDEEVEADRTNAVSLIQKEGKPVTGKNRQFNIDTENVAYADFRGLGSNVFPCNLTDEAYEVMGWDFDSVNFQLEADRWNAIKPHYNRMWFDIHWFTTTEEQDYKRQDIENNKDYQNYLNGIYDYESDYMQSMYKYLDVWQAAGTHTALNYNWKVGERIHEWFNFPSISNPNISAPYDLDAYARSCADLLTYLRRDKGYTSIDCVTFYNEPHYDGDFAAFVDEKAYWVEMVKRVREELEERGLLDEVEVWANEQGSIQSNPMDFPEYTLAHGSQYVDMWAFHSYFSSNDQMKANNYSYWYHFWSYMRDRYGKKIYVTETYPSSYTYGTPTMEEQHSWRCWNDSQGSQIICAANVGLYGVLNWGMTGGYVPKPVGFDPGDGPTAAWINPTTDSQANNVQHMFFEESLITNYIPTNSDVLMVDWTGDDIRGSAFKLPDGGYTILVDAKGNTDLTKETEFAVEETTERVITFNFKGLKKDITLYRYGYDPDTQVLNHHATINQHDYTVKTKNGVFKDTVDKDYGMYLYTTMKPVKQVEIVGDSVIHTLDVSDGSIDFDAKLIACDSGDEIVWSVTAATDGLRNDVANKGTIDKNGTYTMDPSAKKDYKVAIRASLKSDPSVHDTVMIRLVAIK